MAGYYLPVYRSLTTMTIRELRCVQCYKWVSCTKAFGRCCTLRGLLSIAGTRSVWCTRGGTAGAWEGGGGSLLHVV